MTDDTYSVSPPVRHIGASAAKPPMSTIHIAASTPYVRHVDDSAAASPILSIDTDSTTLPSIQPIDVDDTIEKCYNAWSVNNIYSNDKMGMLK